MQFGANGFVETLCETRHQSQSKGWLLSEVREHFQTREKTNGACRITVRHAPWRKL